MAIGFIQQKTAAATSGTSPSVTLDSPPTAGSLLVLTQIGNAGSVNAVSGYGCTTWAVAKAAAFSNYAADIWYGIVNTTPATTGTITLSGSSFYGVNMSEYSGIDNASPLLADDTDTGNSTSPATGGFTAAASPCLYVAVMAVSGGVTTSAGPTGSYTALTTASAGGTMRNYSAYRIDPTAGASSVGWTLGSSAQWEASIKAFRGAPTLTPFIGGTTLLALSSLKSLASL